MSSLDLVQETQALISHQRGVVRRKSCRWAKILSQREFYVLLSTAVLLTLWLPGFDLPPPYGLITFLVVGFGPILALVASSPTPESAKSFFDKRSNH